MMKTVQGHHTQPICSWRRDGASALVLSTRHDRLQCSTHHTRAPKRQRCGIVCFANEPDGSPRPAWHTLPIKHVLESQQFDKVRSDCAYG
jgi:hypothetical protein